MDLKFQTRGVFQILNAIRKNFKILQTVYFALRTTAIILIQLISKKRRGQRHRARADQQQREWVDDEIHIKSHKPIHSPRKNL